MILGAKAVNGANNMLNAQICEYSYLVFLLLKNSKRVRKYVLNLCLLLKGIPKTWRLSKARACWGKVACQVAEATNGRIKNV